MQGFVCQDNRKMIAGFCLRLEHSLQDRASAPRDRCTLHVANILGDRLSRFGLGLHLGRVRDDSVVPDTGRTCAVYHIQLERVLPGGAGPSCLPIARESAHETRCGGSRCRRWSVPRCPACVRASWSLETSRAQPNAPPPARAPLRPQTPHAPGRTPHNPTDNALSTISCCAASPMIHPVSACFRAYNVDYRICPGCTRNGNFQTLGLRRVFEYGRAVQRRRPSTVSVRG